MLSVEFPQVYKFICDGFHGGLLPLKFIEDGKLRLVIKAPKEFLLSAKIKKQFKIYVAPIEQDGLEGFSLVSAFYDNETEPLTITTPLFDEPLTELFKEMLTGENIDVHFFDENNIEFLAYRARIDSNASIQSLISHAKFAPVDKSTAISVIKKLENWYIYSRSTGEENAITIAFEEAIFPDDFIIIDARPSSALYTSSNEIHVNQLERKEPGAFQERDIAAIFSRIFHPYQIYLNPVRQKDQEEICDILIVGNNRIIFVQAKDSPNTEKILQNSIFRKKATTKKHLEKALDQVEGAIKYATRKRRMEFLIGEREFSVEIDASQVCGLVVMKELFLDEYEDYTTMTMKICNAINKPCILLENNEIHSYTMNLHNEPDFIDAFDKVFSIGQETGSFPRLRFGLA